MRNKGFIVFMPPTLIPGRVWYVTCPTDNTVRIALDLEVDGTDIRWFDTVKERGMRAEKIFYQDPEHFVFVREKDEGGGTYTFMPMTLDIFRKYVKYHILLPRDFTNEEDMLHAFEETRKNAW